MRLTLVIAVALVAVGCGGSTAPPATGASPSRSAVSVTLVPTAAPPTSVATATTAVTSPVLRIELTDVRTGERFTLGGFTGKTVIVQGMAVW